LHYLGDFTQSRRVIEWMLQRYTPSAQRSHLSRFQYDQRLTAQITLARGHWLQGYADQAVDLVEKMIANGLALEHNLTLAHVLSDAACFIVLWVGDLPLAARYTKMLREHTKLHALDVWRTYADAFEGEIMIRQGNAIEGVAPLRAGIQSLEAAGFVLYNSAFEGVLAEGLMACGRDDEAETIVASALACCKRTGAVWCVHEIMRIRALSLARNRTEEAIGLAIDGLEIARSSAPGSWELRLAITLVEINDQGGTCASSSMFGGRGDKSCVGFSDALQKARSLTALGN
jgi:hypothetical protein